MDRIVHENIPSLLNHINLYVDSALETSDVGGFPHIKFLEWCIEELIELDEVEEQHWGVNHVEKGSAVHGAFYSEHDGKLDLYITSYKRAQEEYTIHKSDAEATLKRLYNFAEKHINAKSNTISVEEDILSGAYDLVEVMRFQKINLIRFFLFTDGKSTTQTIKKIQLL